MVEVASGFVFTDIVLLSSKLIYANMNVDMTNSNVDVQSSMLCYNFDFWRRWNAIELNTTFSVIPNLFTNLLRFMGHLFN